MVRIAARRLGIVLVVVTVALAGCGSGDGGTPTATLTDTPTEEPTPTETSATGGDGDGPTETPTATEKTASTPTATAGAEPTPTETTEPTPTATQTAVGGEEPDVYESHSAGIREAGSYTLVITATSVESSGGDIVDTGTINITQKHVFATNERYIDYGGTGQQRFEVYQPPNADTAYAYFGGQAREVSPGRAFVFNYTTFTSSGEANVAFTNQLSNLPEPTTGSTALGPADKYVIGSVEQLPQPPTSQYGEVQSFQYTVWVDRDTGIIAKITSEQTIVQDGEEYTIRSAFELVEVGSTTIETPEWVP